MELETRTADLKKQLIEKIPELGSYYCITKDISHSVSSLESHRRKFDWFGAFDYFTCRRGHNMDIEDNVNFDFSFQYFLL